MEHKKWQLKRRYLLIASAGALLPFAMFPTSSKAQSHTTPNANTLKLVDAARSQIGQTVIYDGAYARLDYPNGDVPIERGVCTDVIIRAYRTAFTFDLQQAIHEDMKAHFSLYPKNWGAKGTDRNIDHRRVPNMQTFFSRKGKQLPVSQSAADYQPGDLVTHMLSGNLPHISIVSDHKTAVRKTPLMLHNIGAGTQEEDILFKFKITGHYRFYP